MKIFNNNISTKSYFKNKIIKIDYEKSSEGFELNYVPYISTFYVKPIVVPGENVNIDFYITDYYHKEYLNEDFSERFTVIVRVEGEADEVIKNLKAGNHSVSLGYFTEEKEQRFSIICIDRYGRCSHELFNYFLVRNQVPINEYIMTLNDLFTYNIKNDDNYERKKIVSLTLPIVNKETVKAAIVEEANNITVESNTYTCILADTNNDGKYDNWWGEIIVKYATDYNKNTVLLESEKTRIGLQKLFDDKQALGYNKLRLLPGIYRIDHQVRIYIPTNFTLDMNGATLKLNQFTGASSLMVDLNNTFDSHVINGIIEGDYFSHDYSGSLNNSEWVNGIQIGGESKYSSFENLIIKNITGYGSANGISNSRYGNLGYTYIYPRGIGDKFVLGDVDRLSGLDIPSTNRTTCDFRDINGYGEIGYLSVSIYLGYQGNPCGTWNLICHFYDINKKFIKSTDAYQYRRVAVPSSAKFMRVTILNEAYPTNLSIQLFRVPTHCAFKNIKHENCRCVGMAQSAMKDMLVEDCEYANCGQSSAKCAYDAEDGWDAMQDVTFKRLNFHNNPNNDFLTCAGHNFIIDGQVSGTAYIWERTRSLVVRNCKNIKISLQAGGVSSIIRHGIYRVYNNIFSTGTVARNLSKNNICTGSIGGLLQDCTMYGLVDESEYIRCKIIVISEYIGYIASIRLINCELKPIDTFTNRYKISFNGGHLSSYYFENCTFKGKVSLANHTAFYCARFENCKFDNVTLTANVSANEDDLIEFNNCSINYSENNFIYYSPFAYTKGTFTNIQFNNCVIKSIDNSTNPFIYAYAKPNGACTFNNCAITLPGKMKIFDGYPSNRDFITGYQVNFNNSQIPTDSILVSDYFKENAAIRININND